MLPMINPIYFHSQIKKVMVIIGKHGNNLVNMIEIKLLNVHAF